MLSNRIQKKLLLVLLPCFFIFALLSLPVLFAGAVVAAPIQLVADLFKNIGDFGFGQDVPNEALDLIYKYLESAPGKATIVSYQNNLAKEDGKIPIAYLFIPNFLAGIEKPKDDLIKQQIALAKSKDKLKEVGRYVEDLRKIDPYQKAFDGISSTTIVGYINEFLNFGVFTPMDPEFVASLDAKEYLYPFTKKASVTSEIGWRILFGVEGLPSYNYHDAIDLAFGGNEACGMPIYAVMDGTVEKSDATGNQAGANFGFINKDSIQQRYLHLRDPFPYPVGTKIKKGDFIGYVGSTGLSTSCHLHLAFYENGKPKNPRNYMNFDTPKLPTKK
ncbi:MAG: M23 family metallopeptidase [Erysipelotrichaceae bacterium]